MKFPIGAYNHYNSFEEDCNCDVCEKYSNWLDNKENKITLETRGNQDC